jgi:PTH1 family peptidyl-tRNA hydrolase
MVIDRLAETRAISLSRRAFHSRSGEGKVGAEQILLAKPQTYMNLSGNAVREIVKFHQASLEDILIICDDLNLPPGKIRLRPQGTDGGHKGLKSIIHNLGKQNFPRLRLGIGAPPPDLAAEKYVLSRFSRSERPAVEEALSRAAECALTWIYYGPEEAMNRFNG